MSRLFLFILFLFLLYTILYYLIKAVFLHRKILGRESGPEELVQDPYCQTYIPRRTALRKRVKGRDHYFCSKDCLKKFLKEKKP